MQDGEAYLDMNGTPVALTPAFKIGRAQSCVLTLDDNLVSREHALIAHQPGDAEWLLIDLGSSNGTRLNDQPVSRPTPLRHGDRIQIGMQQLVFQHPAAAGRGYTAPAHEGTIIAVDVVQRWLLLGDIQGSTKRWAAGQQDDLSHGIRAWLRACEALIQQSGGWVNEYLGDGFLALWKTDTLAPERLLALLHQLDALPVVHGLDFRFIVHRAELRSGLGVSSGIEKLAGLEMNYLFKAEKAVAPLGRRLVLSEAATAPLRSHAVFEDLGAIEVPGFERPRSMYTFGQRDA